MLPAHPNGFTVSLHPKRARLGAVVRSSGYQSPAVFDQYRVGPEISRGVLKGQSATLRDWIGFEPLVSSSRY